MESRTYDAQAFMHGCAHTHTQRREAAKHCGGETKRWLNLTKMFSDN